MVPRYWRVKGKSAAPRTIAPCSVSTARLKLSQSKMAKGEVTAKVMTATARARRVIRRAGRMSDERRTLGAASSELGAWRTCHQWRSPAATGAARMGRALNLEAMASPAPTPANTAQPQWTP